MARTLDAIILSRDRCRAVSWEKGQAGIRQTLARGCGHLWAPTGALCPLPGGKPTDQPEQRRGGGGDSHTARPLHLLLVRLWAQGPC